MEETNFKNFEIKEKLPNATPVIILGVISIITCCFYGIGAILGGIGIYLANKDTKLYKENPDLYSNYNNIKTGKVLCIIGVILGVLFLAYLIWFINVVGMDALQDPELMEERMREFFGQ
ncbi:hypothetical protein FLJC2902T_26020 [Flavobacterium limnosediminis JC2902]|uniref:DUF4190 domain-containing protein n=1 Tax=Flavobacterium limnosediminis JC2902 TaxID=1341181 RepID=V6SIU7_9FLAO|nr:CCC motif membrane protein [Flavobacterium limnosediminis]ESU26628.1 hypothetical protein FLJC2902T_26020 [Flavobacterium limnosediminis JC2902]